MLHSWNFGILRRSESGNEICCQSVKDIAAGIPLIVDIDLIFVLPFSLSSFLLVIGSFLEFLWLIVNIYNQIDKSTNFIDANLLCGSNEILISNLHMDLMACTQSMDFDLEYFC